MASWQVWALLSAVFAALTAIFAKVGVAGIHPDVATLIRTVVILIVLSALVAASGDPFGEVTYQVGHDGLVSLVIDRLTP